MVASEILPAARRSARVPAAFSSVAISWRSLTTSWCFLVEGGAGGRQLLRGAAQGVGQTVAVGLGRRFRVEIGDRFRNAVAQRAKVLRRSVARSNPSHSSCSCQSSFVDQSCASLDNDALLLHRDANDKVDMDPALR